MVSKKAALFSFAAIVLAIALAFSLATGASVGHDGYTIGTVTMTPSTSACIGGTLFLSGSGANPGDVLWVHLTGVQGVYEAGLGTVTVDGSGSWSLTATIPYTVNVAPTSGGGTAATITGTWEVGAHVVTNGDAGYVQIGTIELVDCAETLPSTGLPVTTAGLLGAGVLASVAAGLGAIRYRMKR